MTDDSEDFKITAEDVGRVALDEDGGEWRIVAIDPAGGDMPVIARLDSDPASLRAVSLTGESLFRDGHLYAWKPRTLTAPKRWWNVYRDQGELTAHHYPEFEDAAERNRENLIARVFSEHWHGCDENRFDPQSMEEADD